MTDSEPDTDPADPDESNGEQDTDPAPVELTTRPGSDQADERQTEREDERAQNARVSRETLVGYMFWAAFGLLGLLTAVALFGFYTSVTRVITIWITDQYQPIFTALFNLIVVVACLVGLSVLVRLLRTTEDESDPD